MKVTQEQYDAQVQKIQELEAAYKEAQKQLIASKAEGDLRENAEYEGASKELDLLNDSITEARKLLMQMQISISASGSNKISVLSKFKVLNMNTNEILELELVTINGTPPKSVSAMSKFGRIVLGKRIGDIIAYTDNAYRTQSFKVLDIL